MPEPRIVPPDEARRLTVWTGIRTDTERLIAAAPDLAHTAAVLGGRLAAVEALAQERCEFYSTGTCADEPLWQEGDYYGRAPNAPYLANRYCWPCRLRAALGVTE